MGLTVWKFPLEVKDEQTLPLPAGAMILKVGTQDDRPVLWALCDPEARTEDRQIATRGTGHPVEDDLYYLGSYLILGGTFVGHVFGRTR